MIYTTREEAELECRLNERKIGGTWEPRKIVHVFGAHTGSPYEDEAWQPTQVIEVHEGPIEHVTLGGPEDHGEDAMRARRTQPWRD